MQLASYGPALVECEMPPVVPVWWPGVLPKWILVPAPLVLVVCCPVYPECLIMVVPEAAPRFLEPSMSLPICGSSLLATFDCIVNC